MKFRPLIAPIGKELLQEGIHPKQGRQQDATISVLNIGRMNDGVEQQAQRIYENMALLTFDLFACIIAV